MFQSIKLIDDIKTISEDINEDSRYFIIAGEEFDFLALKDVVKAFWMGAVFPKIFTANEIYSDKAFLCELSKETNQSWLQNEEGYFCIDCTSFMVFVNGLDPYVNTRLEEMFSLTPQDSIMLGGGVGRTSMDDNSTMFNGKEFVNNGVIVIGTSSALSIGVKHGYKSEKGFYNVTECNGNIIEKFDNENAFDFYKNLLKLKYNVTVTKENLFDVGLKYPLLLSVTFGEDIVRTPVKTDGKSIWTVGEVPKDTFVSIGLVSDEELLEAAKKSAFIAKKDTPPDAQNCFVFDCFGRYVYSPERFPQEIGVIKQQMQNLQIYGVLAIGEIANTSTSNLEFYNNTCVVGVE